MISTDPWVWIAAFMTLCSYSLLYGENLFFHIGEYTFTATVVANQVVTAIPTLRSNFLPLFTGAKPWFIIPLLLGIMTLAIVWRKYAWIASFPYALILGTNTGIYLRGAVGTTIIGNLQAIMREGGLILTGSPTDQLGYAVRIILTVCGLIYLFFTLFLKGPLSRPTEYIRSFGKYAWLVFFALMIGNGVQQYSGLATSAINRLIRTWLGF